MTLPNRVLFSSLDLPETASSSFNFETSSICSEEMEVLSKQQQDALTMELCRLRHINDPILARGVVARYAAGDGVTAEGWCRISPLAGNKEDGTGYIQVSAEGVNKFALLHELLLWSQGLDLGPGEQMSHLCHRTKCLIPEHVIKELERLNQIRKYCQVWVNCQHDPNCTLKLLICIHRPYCIKHCAGFTSWEDFLQNGIH